MRTGAGVAGSGKGCFAPCLKLGFESAGGFVEMLRRSGHIPK
jgi:hypothetical protein